MLYLRAYQRLAHPFLKTGSCNFDALPLNFCDWVNPEVNNLTWKADYNPEYGKYDNFERRVSCVVRARLSL